MMGERGWFNCSVFLEVFLSVVWRSLNTAQFVKIKKEAFRPLRDIHASQVLCG